MGQGRRDKGGWWTIEGKRDLKKGLEEVISEELVQSMKCDNRKVGQENKNYRNERRRQRRLKLLNTTEVVK